MECGHSKLNHGPNTHPFKQLSKLEQRRILPILRLSVSHSTNIITLGQALRNQLTHLQDRNIYANSCDRVLGDVKSIYDVLTGSPNWGPAQFWKVKKVPPLLPIPHWPMPCRNVMSYILKDEFVLTRKRTDQMWPITRIENSWEVARKGLNLQRNSRQPLVCCLESTICRPSQPKPSHFLKLLEFWGLCRPPVALVMSLPRG